MSFSLNPFMHPSGIHSEIEAPPRNSFVTVPLVFAVIRMEVFRFCAFANVPSTIVEANERHSTTR